MGYSAGLGLQFVIFVERREEVPALVAAALGKPVAGEGVSELELARRYYSRVPPPTKAFHFSAYKEHQVCVALDSLFQRKCAYCECYYDAVDARDIEHYRPKGGVAQTNPPHIGYWWLASAWDNLLPSCQACNRRRRHGVFDPSKSLEELDRAYLDLPDTMTGKGNEFPLRPPSTWITSEGGDIATEDPLLINPSIRNPERHLEWVFDWDRSKAALWEAEDLLVSIRPTEEQGVQDPYGKASIAVYGLNRIGLVRERMARLTLLQRVCLEVVEDISMLAQPQSDLGREMSNRRLQRHMQEFTSLGEAREPHAGMARAYINLFDREVRSMPGLRFPALGPVDLMDIA